MNSHRLRFPSGWDSTLPAVSQKHSGVGSLQVMIPGVAGLLPRYVAGLKFPYGGIVNPAKLARGMKRVVEGLGVMGMRRSC